jgi:hypothetical protein
MTDEGEPLTLLESAIREVKRDVLDMAALMEGFLAADLYVPSASPMERIDEIEPLIWNLDGHDMIAVFTHPDRALPFQELTPNLAVMSGRKFVAVMPRGAGIFVNPRTEAYTFLIPPEAAQALREVG